MADLGFLDVQANFALDMGCLHSLAPENRTRYAQLLAVRMTSGGLYLLYGFDFDCAVQGGPSGFDTDEKKHASARASSRLEATQYARKTPRGWYLLARR